MNPSRSCKLIALSQQHMLVAPVLVGPVLVVAVVVVDGEGFTVTPITSDIVGVNRKCEATP